MVRAQLLLSSVETQLGNIAEARDIIRKVINATIELTNTNQTQEAQMLLSLEAALLADLGDLKGRLAIYQELLEIRESLYGQEGQEKIETLLGLAEVYLDMKENEKAEQHLQQAIKLKKEGKPSIELGYSDPLYRLKQLTLMADICEQMGKLKEQKEALEEAFTMALNLPQGGEYHIGLALIILPRLNRVNLLLKDEKAHEEGEAILRKMQEEAHVTDEMLSGVLSNEKEHRRRTVSDLTEALAIMYGRI